MYLEMKGFDDSALQRFIAQPFKKLRGRGGNLERVTHTPKIANDGKRALVLRKRNTG